MKINWKTRLKNPATLTALISAVLLFAKQIADALNGLYALTGDNYEVRIVHEVIDRQYVNPPDAETLQ